MDKKLEELVQRLKETGGTNLRSVVLYGSAASGEFRPKHSDLNVLCLLHQINAVELYKLRHVARWWARKGHPSPLFFTWEELQRAADIYAIELLEIRAHRRVLFGEDVFRSLQVPMKLHRLQVERELRHKLITLRQAYAAAAADGKALRALMIRSASTFALLFRHALIALGEEAPPSKREAVGRLAALLGFDASSFETLFEVRAGRQRGKNLDAKEVFNSYLMAITRAVDEIDRRFERLAVQ